MGGNLNSYFYWIAMIVTISYCSQTVPNDIYWVWVCDASQRSSYHSFPGYVVSHQQQLLIMRQERTTVQCNYDRPFFFQNTHSRQSCPMFILTQESVFFYAILIGRDAKNILVIFNDYVYNVSHIVTGSHLENALCKLWSFSLLVSFLSAFSELHSDSVTTVLYAVLCYSSETKKTIQKT